VEAFMRINSSPSFLNKSPKVTAEKSLETKSTPLEKASKSTQIDELKTNIGHLISREKLLALASDLKNGHIDREQASERFVEDVVNNSLDDKLSPKDKEDLSKAISDFFKDDQDFIFALEKNLINLA